MTVHSVTTRVVRHIVHAWREADYVQRRMFELRTGIEATDPWERF